MPSHIARSIYDAVTTEDVAGAVINDNEGLGNEAANLVFDLAAPYGMTKGLNLANKVVDYTKLAKELRMPKINIPKPNLFVPSITKTNQSSAENYTANILKFLNKRNEIVNPSKQFRLTKDFANYLESQGVDLTKLTDSDLIKLMDARKQIVESTLPNSGRSATIHSIKLGNTRVDEANLFNNGQQIASIEGRTDIRPISKDLSSHVASISSTDPSQHKVSESLYNILINWSKNRGGKGIVSGEELVSPEKTYKVWEHYPTKTLLGNYGTHKFGQGRGLTNLPMYTIDNGPVYLINSSSAITVPTKHAGWFHPSMINKAGQMRLPNWNSKDIFKFTIPGIYNGLSKN